MGPTCLFLLMFESRVERHLFCDIETLNGYMYSAGCQRTPGFGASQYYKGRTTYNWVPKTSHVSHSLYPYFESRNLSLHRVSPFFS